MMLRYSFLVLFCLATLINRSQTDSVPDRLTWDKSKKNSKELIKLLTDPLDLQVFKKLKPMHSNSGGGGKKSYYYRPAQKGFYYSYFFFPPFGEHGPRITTFQKDSNMSGYMDTAEVFILLTCDAKDKDLGKMNLVGSALPELMKKLGDNYLKSVDTLVYQYKNVLLILSGETYVKWFKVVRLNKPFKNFDEISKAEDLISYFKY